MSASNLLIGDVAIGGRVLLAPMTGVSDLPFRKIASQQGAPYVATEMVACDLFAQGRPDIIRRAAVGEGLPLMVIQLVGREEKWLAKGAAMAQAAGAQIIDLNMGCPAREVTGGLSGSALMRDLDRAERLIAATVNATSRPVTLKMRLGWDDGMRNAPELARRAQGAGVKAITVHGRTRQQFYKGQADWRAVREVKAATALPVIVNGDIVDAASARLALEQSGADAVMIGRGAYGRPWIARAIAQALQEGGVHQEPEAAIRLEIVIDHFHESLRFYGEALGLKVFRKHLAWYVERELCEAEPDLWRAERARLCQLSSPVSVIEALRALWRRQAA